MFIPMTGAPYLRDLDDVRRNPTLDDLANFHKLSQMLPRCIHPRTISWNPMITRSASAIAHHLFVDEIFGQNIHGHDDQPQECRGCHGYV